MSRTADIITRARDALSDPRKERYSDERLYRLIDEAQTTIARFARTLRKEIFLPVYPGIADYVMPDDCYLVTRVSYEQRALELKSHEEMDKINASWEEETDTEPKYVLFDKHTPGKFKIYPKVDYTPADYGLVPTIDVPQFGTLYGQNVGLSLILSTFVNGELVQASLAENTGMLQTITDNGYLHVRYIYRPSKVSATVEPEVPEMFDKAIKHYVVGAALRDDRETQNRAMGNEEMQLFSEELQLAKRFDTVDNTAINTQYLTKYSTGFML
ncbi:MAG: hypothetical protein JHC33_09755 [Ignisphaera sp.]|nr:hypothetical protein [Ignisphaera sp.]